MMDAAGLSAFADACGVAGAITIVGTYGLLQTARWRAEQLRYSAANASGAALILFSLAFTPNLPSIVIESFWLLISLGGMVKAWRARKRH